METGTPHELNLNPRDVVEHESGHEYTITRFNDHTKEWMATSPRYTDEVGLENRCTFRIVSRATPQPDLTGPVRTVTRKEIVSGQYGAVKVEHRIGGCMLRLDGDGFWCSENTPALRAAIATLTQIADALEARDA